MVVGWGKSTAFRVFHICWLSWSGDGTFRNGTFSASTLNPAAWFTIQIENRGRAKGGGEREEEEEARLGPVHHWHSGSAQRLN